MLKGYMYLIQNIQLTNSPICQQLVVLSNYYFLYKLNDHMQFDMLKCISMHRYDK